MLYLQCHDYDMRDKWVKGLRYALQLDQYLKQKENSNVYPFSYIITVKILKFGTSQTFAIIVLKLEKFDVTLH